MSSDQSDREIRRKRAERAWRARRWKLTWLVIIDGDTGYTIDAYPNELERYRRQFGSTVIAEFACPAAAQLRVWEVMRKRCDELNAAEAPGKPLRSWADAIAAEEAAEKQADEIVRKQWGRQR